MDNWKTELLTKLRNEHKSYSDMIDFCCDSLILNNSIQSILENSGMYFETYCGDIFYTDDNGDETDDCKDFYQQFIIDGQGAERLAEYTNEVVLYCEEADIYLLCVDHFGTPWMGVPSNWKNEV